MRHAVAVVASDHVTRSLHLMELLYFPMTSYELGIRARFSVFHLRMRSCTGDSEPLKSHSPS